MSGENLENFINVKNILIDMGTYFQVQVIFLFEETPDFSQGTDVYPLYVFPSISTSANRIISNEI